MRSTSALVVLRPTLSRSAFLATSKGMPQLSSTGDGLGGGGEESLCQRSEGKGSLCSPGLGEGTLPLLPSTSSPGWGCVDPSPLSAKHL